jgi:CRISPR associated protein Cas1
LTSFDVLRASLDWAESIDAIRLCEAQAAALYWKAWSDISIRMRERDLTRIPAHWARYNTRASVLTGAPRAATHPINALLNYLYALLESEARIALLAAGLDPTLGVLHADQRNRDSFALDAMEPVRPDVDAFVLDLLEKRVFSARDFVEITNGVCRIRAPLTHDLALTLPRWRQLMAPIVAHLAQAFRTTLLERKEMPITASETPRTDTRDSVEQRSSAPSTLHTTPRKPPKVRLYASKVWNAPRPESPALLPAACASCGKPVAKRRRQHCEACLPGARRARAERAIAEARKTLALQALRGDDPRARSDANRTRGAANAEHHRRNREWVRGHGDSERDEAWCLREITPKLDGFSLSDRRRDGAIPGRLFALSCRDACSAPAPLGCVPYARTRSRYT